MIPISLFKFSADKSKIESVLTLVSCCDVCSIHYRLDIYIYKGVFLVIIDIEGKDVHDIKSAVVDDEF